MDACECGYDERKTRKPSLLAISPAGADQSKKGTALPYTHEANYPRDLRAGQAESTCVQ